MPEPEPLPDGWEQGVGRGQWLHRERVASVYLLDGEYSAAADETWLDGLWPTFAAAATAALACGPMTWAALRRRQDEED